MEARRICKTSPLPEPAVRVNDPVRTEQHLSNDQLFPLVSKSANTGVPHPETHANFTESWLTR